MRVVIDRPMISFAFQPNMRSAALFQLVTIPLRSLLTMASSEDSTMAASRSSARSAVAGMAGFDGEGLIARASASITSAFFGFTQSPPIRSPMLDRFAPISPHAAGELHTFALLLERMLLIRLQLSAIGCVS